MGDGKYLVVECLLGKMLCNQLLEAVFKVYSKARHRGKVDAAVGCLGIILIC